MKYQIELNGRQVEYELQRKPVKNINLRIRPDGSVYVSANQFVPQFVIEDFLRSRAGSVLKALDHYARAAACAPWAKRYVDGETVRVLGRDRRLRVVQAAKGSVEDDGEVLTLAVKDPADLELKKRTLDRWLQQLCRDIVRSLCLRVWPAFQRHGVAFPELRFRTMTSRWGSCQPVRGVITFNYTLVGMPIPCIEYVVVHEFTHFLCPDHSGRFYALLSGFLPDWRERKYLLDHPYACK